MASLKEIKNRIASVSGTLKITSAMKLVASAKLRKAQQAITNMLPYERQLQRILANLLAQASLSSGEQSGAGEVHSRFAAAEYRLTPAATPDEDISPADIASWDGRPDRPSQVAIVAFSSNSSLCGAFNANAIRKTLAVIDEYRTSGLSDSDIVVYSVGRKMAEAMRKAGFPSPDDYTKMAESPGYEAASALSQELIDGYSSGRFSKVELVYNHFKSTASQITVREPYLPMAATPDDIAAVPRPYSAAAEREWTRPGAGGVPSESGYSDDMIIEPSPEELLEELLPKVQRLKLYTALLDTNAAEHAARTVAMQTATDNGNELLESLTLEYNKGRQQKITSEILDIVGGTMQ